MALYVVYAVITYVIVVAFNMFIPHCMRTSAELDAAMRGPAPKMASFQAGPGNDAKAPVADANSVERQANLADTDPAESRGYGFKMSIWG